MCHRNLEERPFSEAVAKNKGANVMLMMPLNPKYGHGGVFYSPRKLTNGLTSVNPVQLDVDYFARQ